LDTSNGKHLLS